jgi:hypothetical protein
MSQAARENIREMLANCAQFRAWMGAASVEEAEALVFMHSASTVAAPVCLLYDEVDEDRRLGFSHFGDGGSVRAVIDVAVPDEDGYEAQFGAVSGEVETLRGEILARVSAAGPDVSRVRLEGIMRSAEGDNSPFVQVHLLIDWGV